MNSKSEFHQASIVRVVATNGLQTEQGEDKGWVKTGSPPQEQVGSGNWLALSDETKKFHRDRYRDFFSRPNIFETDTETFFSDQMFLRLIPRLLQVKK